MKKALIAAALCVAATAQAAVVEFQLQGVITYSKSKFIKAGSELSGSFSYDTDALPALSTDKSALYSFAAPASLVVNVGSRTFSTDNLNVGIADDFNTFFEDALAVYGTDVKWGGAKRPHTSMGFVLGSANGNTDALDGIGLPSDINLDEFDAPGSGLAYLSRNGKTLIQAQITSISSSQATPVPEPGTLALTALGLGPVLLLSRRKKQKTA